MKAVFKIFLIIPLLAFYSCDEILYEEDLSSKTISLVAPVNYAQFNSTGINFTWNAVENAGQYRLQIATPDFTNPMQVVLDTIVSDTSFSTQLNVGNYEWRVQATNSAYQTPFASRFFSILSNDNFENNTVTLQAPAANLITNNTTQYLSWQPIIGASNYQIQIFDANSNIISDQTLTVTNLNYTFPEGNFQWRVRAGNGAEQTLFSSRNLLVDTTAPNTPVLSAPVNASTATDTEVNFQWSRIPIPGSVEKDSIYIYTNIAMSSLLLKSEANSTFTATFETGTYFWKVKSFDAAGNIGTQSTAFSFIVE